MINVLSLGYYTMMMMMNPQPYCIVEESVEVVTKWYAISPNPIPNPLTLSHIPKPSPESLTLSLNPNCVGDSWVMLSL